MNEKYFSNEKVSASAGSGKTFSLTTRFIALACAGGDGGNPDPFSIIALTFTKKAAGEFLSKILTRLADAAESDEGAESLAREIAGISPDGAKPDREKFARTLALCAAQINRLKLGTIDSFFSSIIRQNAGALKIFAPVEVMGGDGFEARKLRAEAISRVMAHNAVGERDAKNFAELIKKASFGHDEKRVRPIIEKAVDAAHTAYLRHRNLDCWGNGALAGVKLPNVRWDDAAYARGLDILRADMGSSKELAKLLEFFEKSGYAGLGSIANATCEAVFEAKRGGVLRGITSLPYKGKPVAITCAATMDEMLDMLFAEHCGRLFEATAAMGKIAALFEREYDAAVRSRGKITFSDMPLILADENRKTEKEIIEYRLDAKFRHWLFDEFQDTSRIQWEVLRNLVEEAIVSPEKSFYYVGDVKQSIYTWRDADPRLFNGIFAYYNANSQLIRPAKPLTVSWRSGRYVIDAVNAIFGNQQNLARAFQKDAADIFSADFNTHKSAEEDPSLSKKPQASFAQLRLYDSARDTVSDSAAVCAEVLDILRTTNPVGRGITCAVLVSKNVQANIIVDFLKQNGYNAAGEMSINIADDRPVVSIFAAILRWLAHPKNTASVAYCKMAGFEEFAENFSEDFADKARAKVFGEGFESFALDYAEFVRKKLGKSPIELKWLIDACAKLDAAQTPTIDEAVEAISDTELNTSARSDVIQVMTVHKSKGLAFGMVIMPVKPEVRTRSSLVEMGGAVMISPSGTLAEMDKTLYAKARDAKTTEYFETICKLYVAATRPERALYIISPKISEGSLKADKSAGIHFTQNLLEAFEPRFGCCTSAKQMKELYAEVLSTGELSMGDPRWFEKIAPETDSSAAAEPKFIPNLRPVRALQTLAPSRGNAPAGAPDEQPPAPSAAAQSGIQVHKLLEKMHSPEDFDFAKVENPDIRAGLEKLFANPKFRRNFDAHSTFAASEFWFEYVADGHAEVGSIDRIAVFADGANRYASAEILDYKPFASNPEKYAQQMQIYKTAAAKIFGIAPEKIVCRIAGYIDGKVAEI